MIEKFQGILGADIVTVLHLQLFPSVELCRSYKAANSLSGILAVDEDLKSFKSAWLVIRTDAFAIPKRSSHDKIISNWLQLLPGFRTAKVEEEQLDPTVIAVGTC